MVLGDSLSAGYGLANGTGWVHLLQQRLRHANLSYDVINASVSGDTTRTTLARLPRALETHRPALVIVALGGNDGLRGIAVSEIYNNLSGIVRLSRRAGAAVLLVGVTLPPNYGAAYVKQFAAVFGRVAKEQHLALVASIMHGFAEDRTMFQNDQIHPGAQAQTLMLENVWRELRPQLKQ